MSQSAAANKQLHDAFELFNQASEQLAGSYQVLQKQVSDLNQKLADSHDERRQLLQEITALQKETSRAQRLSTMGEMTARLAHQIRTPLATALLYASQLKHASLRREQHDCFVDRLLVGLRHLDHMVNDMLVFARGGRSGEENVSLTELLEQVRQSLMPELAEKQARWRINGKPDVLVRAQREVLASAMGNLATNALNACESTPCLDWTVEIEDAQVILTIQDNGPGIADEVSEKIFEPFFTTKTNGTGLGLAVVRAVITAHQGEIELDSEFKQGARFVVRLPLLDSLGQTSGEIIQRKEITKKVSSRCS